MNKSVFIICFLLIFPTFGQDKPPIETTDKKSTPKKLPPLILKEIVKAQTPPSKRIFFVIDVSGSMESDGKISKALSFVQTTCQSPFDEFEVAIITFADTSVRWQGFAIKDDPKPCPDKWAKFPSKEASDAAQKWLNTFPGRGGTEPLDAIKEALEEPRSDLSIVYITDGEYSHLQIMDIIKELQTKREEKGLGRAVISVFGVGGAEDQKHLSKIGKDEMGGFYVEEKPKDTKKETHPTPTSSPDPLPPPIEDTPKSDEQHPEEEFPH